MDIGAVVVTYNRLEKLKKSLAAFADMTQLPKYVLVVDNASTDGTDEYLETWKEQDADFEKIVVHMEKNVGGSGGFHEGLRRSLALPADWIWVSDDDAYPAKDAFARTSQYLEACDAEDIAAVCAKVIKNGQLDVNHSKGYVQNGIFIKETIADSRQYETEQAFELFSLTYVGAVLNKSILQKAGLPNKQYFIYWDDLEHGLRMKKYGKILCVPSITAYHEVGKELDGINWRLYYSYRNMTDTYRKHFPGTCFAFYALKVKIKVLFNVLSGRHNLKINILEAGFNDALHGKFGMHAVYRPGWKPEQ